MTRYEPTKNAMADDRGALHGACLCGQVRFELSVVPRALYQCHCSLCRKQGGSLANTATIVAASDFRWIAGQQSIRSWAKPSGFRSDFCANCGSPVPNPLRASPYVWVPVGLIESDFDAVIRAQLCVASKATWDPLDAPGVRHEAVPDLAELLALLGATPPDAPDSL